MKGPLSLRVAQSVQLKASSEKIDERLTAWVGAFRLPPSPGGHSGPQWYSGQRHGARLLIQRQIPVWEPAAAVWRPVYHVEAVLERVSERDVQVVTRLAWHPEIIVTLLGMTGAMLSLHHFMSGAPQFWGLVALLAVGVSLRWFLAARRVRREARVLRHALELLDT